jgi:hypothetical protein
VPLYRRALTAEQDFELLFGHGFGSSYFRSDVEREGAWWANRDRLLEHHRAGLRPWGWWEYEAREPRPHFEAQRLLELGVCDDEEQQAIEDEWARRDLGAHRWALLNAKSGGAPFPRSLEIQRRTYGIPLDRPQLEPSQYEPRDAERSG